MAQYSVTTCLKIKGDGYAPKEEVSSRDRAGTARRKVRPRKWTHPAERISSGAVNLKRRFVELTVGVIRIADTKKHGSVSIEAFKPRR